MSKVDSKAVQTELRIRLATLVGWLGPSAIENASLLYSPPPRTDITRQNYNHPPGLGLDHASNPIPTLLIALGQAVLGTLIWNNFRNRCETDLNPNRMTTITTFGGLAESTVEWLNQLESCAVFLVVRKVVARNSGRCEDQMTATDSMPVMDEALLLIFVEDLHSELKSSLGSFVEVASLKTAMDAATTLGDARDGVIELL